MLITPALLKKPMISISLLLVVITAVCVWAWLPTPIKVAKNDFFPLQKGLVWLYKVDTQLSDGEQVRYFSIENYGPTHLKDDYEDEPVSIRHTSDGTDYYILQDDTGSYRVGRKTLVEYKPRFEPRPIRFLPNTKDLEVGRTWINTSQTYVLHSSGNAASNTTGTIELNMEYTIISVDEKVSTLAGVFQNCVLVEGKATASIYADPRSGYQEIEITHREWFAPGVGLIKLVREEPLNLTYFKGGSKRFELISFNGQ